MKSHPTHTRTHSIGLSALAALISNTLSFYHVDFLIVECPRCIVCTLAAIHCWLPPNWWTDSFVLNGIYVQPHNYSSLLVNQMKQEIPNRFTLTSLCAPKTQKQNGKKMMQKFVSFLTAISMASVFVLLFLSFFFFLFFTSRTDHCKRLMFSLHRNVKCRNLTVKWRYSMPTPSKSMPTVIEVVFLFFFVFFFNLKLNLRHRQSR